MRSWLSRLRRQSEEEFVAEVDAHLAHETDEQIERGVPAEEARYAALRRFGNVTRHVERFREASPWFWLETLWQDVRYGMRQLRRQPSFTVVAVTTLALGFGSNAAVLAIVQAVLFGPLPFRDSGRLVVIRTQNPSQNVHDEGLSYANVRDLEIGSRSVVDLAAVAFARATITGGDYPELTTALYAPARFFSVVGVQPVLGRLFKPDEEVVGAGRVALLGFDVWERRFGGDPRVLGRIVQVSGVDRVVVGVLPHAVWPGTADVAAKYGDTGVVLPPFADGTGRHLEERFGTGFFLVIGRLRPGVSFETARARLDTVANALERDYPVNRGYGLSVDSLPEYTIRATRTPLWIAYAAVCCVLLIACVNVAHLVSARTAGRYREFALRASLGASRARVMRQLATESVVLALAATAAGLLLAAGGIRVLVAFGPVELQGLDRATVDWIVVSLTLVLGAGVGLLAALVPAAHGAAPRPEVLKGRGGSGPPVLGRRALAPLVITEVALSLVILTAASLMVRSFVHIARFEWGFSTERLLVVPLHLGTPPEGLPAYTDRLLQAVRAVPGVTAAGGIDILTYLKKGENYYRFEVEGRRGVPHTELFIDSVTPGYFRTLEIPLLTGREIADADRPDTPTAIVINATAAQRLWPGERPIGKRMRVLNDDGTPGLPWWTVVGVVADTRFTGLDAPAGAQVFVSQAQAPSGIVTLVVRTRLAADAIAASLRHAIWRVDKNLPVPHVDAMSNILDRMSAQRRFVTQLLVAFGGCGVLLAAVGLYGVVSCLVAERTHEIGVRIAVGAARRDVLQLVLGRSLRPVTLGLLAGLGGGVLETRWLRNLLFEVQPTDPLALGTSVAVLLAVALIAACVPARRAMRVDPIEVLRAE